MNRNGLLNVAKAWGMLAVFAAGVYMLSQIPVRYDGFLLGGFVACAVGVVTLAAYQLGRK